MTNRFILNWCMTIFLIEISMQYNDSYDEKIFSFANNINTVDGGTHLSGFRGAITRTINNYAESSGLDEECKGHAFRRRRPRRPGRDHQRQDPTAAV